jgi:DNA-binding transcriptional LysR family regulator
MLLLILGVSRRLADRRQELGMARPAVAEHLNYSEASRRIHVAQPAISQTILDLEEELGVRLLLRDRRTVRLTPAGETFRREALDILLRNQEAVRLSKRASLGEVGQLRIGFYPSTGAAVLPALVQEYHRHFPDVDLTLREMTSQQQLEAFDEGQLDVGFAWPLPAERSKEFHQELVESIPSNSESSLPATMTSTLACLKAWHRAAGGDASVTKMSIALKGAI